MGDDHHPKPLNKRPKLDHRRPLEDNGQEELRRRALQEMGLATNASATSAICPSKAKVEEWQLASDGVPFALNGSQVLLVNAATQTDEWKDRRCENCNAEYKEDDDTVLCPACSFWTHYQCIKREVYDGCEVEGAQECTFCYYLQNKKGKMEIEMSKHERMIDLTEAADEDSHDADDAPKGAPETWQYYWNIIRPSDGRNIKVGDYVYIPDDEKQVVVIWLVDFLFRDAQEQLYAVVSELCFPENIMRYSNQKFYPNEVYLMTAESSDVDAISYARLDSIKGPPIAVLKVPEFRKYIPRCIPKAHVYIERNYYNRCYKNPKKYSTKPARVGDYKTCTKNFALKPHETPMDSSKHKEKRYEEIDWIKVRIQPKDLS